MTKKQFADRMSVAMGGRCGRQALKWTDAFIKTLTEVLAEGESVQFRGFGEFGTAMTPRKSGRDLRTGERIEIAPRRKIKVREYHDLRVALEKRR